MKCERAGACGAPSLRVPFAKYIEAGNFLRLMSVKRVLKSNSDFAMVVLFLLVWSL